MRHTRNTTQPSLSFASHVLCPLLFLLGSTPWVLAQAGRGGISGTVTDPAGAVVARA
jgi:hypothetical protein